MAIEMFKRRLASSVTQRSSTFYFFYHQGTRVKAGLNINVYVYARGSAMYSLVMSLCPPHDIVMSFYVYIFLIMAVD